jgi:hypothetical protein
MGRQLLCGQLRSLAATDIPGLDRQSVRLADTSPQRQLSSGIEVASRVMPNDSRLGVADSRLAQIKAQCEERRG